MTGLGISEGHLCTQLCWVRRYGKLNSSPLPKVLSLLEFCIGNILRVNTSVAIFFPHLFTYALFSLALAAKISTNILASEFNPG